MQGLAEVEGNPARVTESKQRIERDIGPLSKEVKRQLNDMGRQELFPSEYQAPDMEQGGNHDMDFLLSNSEDLLRNSLSYVLCTGLVVLQLWMLFSSQLLCAARFESVYSNSLQMNFIFLFMLAVFAPIRKKWAPVPSCKWAVSASNSKRLPITFMPLEVQRNKLV